MKLRFRVNCVEQEIEIDPGCGVILLIDEIAAKLGYSDSSSMKLVHKGKSLKADQTLSEYLVSEDDVIMVLFPKSAKVSKVADNTSDWAKNSLQGPYKNYTEEVTFGSSNFPGDLITSGDAIGHLILGASVSSKDWPRVGILALD